MVKTHAKSSVRGPASLHQCPCLKDIVNTFRQISPALLGTKTTQIKAPDLEYMEHVFEF